MGRFITNDYQYVDLKLPSGTLWAACNVGANKPTENGYYLSWGETKSKKEYTRDTYNYESLKMKYKNLDGVETLLDDEDAAHIYMGGDWRMPTESQANELIGHTNLIDCGSYVELRRIDEEKLGCKGAKLIIPLGGYYDRNRCNDKDEFGYLWASNSTYHALTYSEIPTIVLSRVQKYKTRFDGYYGQNIRGVLTPKQ